MRTMMKTSFAGLCLAFAISALVPSSAATQQVCGFCTDEYEEGEFIHVFGARGAWFEGAPGSMGCHYEDYAYGQCAQYHNAGCDIGSLVALADLQEAIDSGDRNGALALAMTRPEHIAFDHASNEFTVSLCDGRTLAILKSSSEVVERG